MLSYDVSGRLTTIVGPAGAAIRLTLDSASRLVRAENAEGVVADEVPFRIGRQRRLAGSTRELLVFCVRKHQNSKRVGIKNLI